MSVQPGRLTGRAARRNRWKKRDRSRTPKPGTVQLPLETDLEFLGWLDASNALEKHARIVDHRNDASVGLSILYSDWKMQKCQSAHMNMMAVLIENATHSLADVIYRKTPPPLLALRRRISRAERFSIATGNAFDLSHTLFTEMATKINSS